MPRFLAPALAILLLLPLALAQSHGEGEEHMLLLHDGAPDGHAVAGSLAHYGFALVDAHGTPVVHHDNHYVVRQGDRVLFETGDAHEYDGLFGLDLTFPQAGPFAADATTTSGESGASATFAGAAVAPDESVRPRVELTAPETAAAYAPVPIEVRVVDANGTLMAHSDAIVEVRRASDSGLVARWHGHTHETGQAFRFAFPGPGEYEIHATGYDAFPTPSRAGWRSVAAVATVQVERPEPASPDAASSGVVASEDVLRDGEGLVLHLTTDPTSFAGGAVDYPFGPGTLLHLNGLVVNESGPALVQHVDFEARLTGPFGEVFDSLTLHEYDGHFDLTVGDLTPGTYTFTLDASRGDWEASVRKTLHVLPPALPLTAGAYRVHMEPVAARPGEPADLVFSLVDAAGRPLSHGEVDVTILPADGGPQAANFKLHTHGSGRMSAKYAFPSEGAWLVRATPSILEAKTAIAKAVSFPVDVETGAMPLPETAAPPEPEVESLEVPSLHPAGLLAALGLVCLTWRRGGSRVHASRIRDTRPGASTRGR